MMSSDFEKALAAATRVEPSPEADACVIAAIGLESAKRARRRAAARVLAAAAVGAVLLSVANFRFSADSPVAPSAVQADDAGEIMLDIIGLASSADLYDISDADSAEGLILGLF